MTETIPIRFYVEFWREDFFSLPKSAQDALGEFLEKLQQNPESDEVLQKATRDKNRSNRFAYVFAPGYVVYWKLVRSDPKPIIQLNSLKPIRIDVLDVRKL
jgi:hypothetical protein